MLTNVHCLMKCSGTFNPLHILTQLIKGAELIHGLTTYSDTSVIKYCAILISDVSCKRENECNVTCRESSYIYEKYRLSITLHLLHVLETDLCGPVYFTTRCSPSGFQELPAPFVSSSWCRMLPAFHTSPPMTSLHSGHT